MKAKLPWFRMYAEFVDDPKCQRLPGDLFKFWMNCLGLACQNDGVLPSVSDICWKMKVSEKRTTSSIAALYEYGLLDQEAETFSPHNWASRQYKSDVSTERVRRFRNGKETFHGTEPKREETGNGTSPDTETEAEAELTPNAAGAACLFPVAPLHQKRRKGKRTTEEILKALGYRADWWRQFWEVFPCRDGMNPGMDAFEKRVRTLEVFALVLAGAKAYAERAAHNPELRLKYAQGWINDERWTDEGQAPHARSPDRQSKGFMDSVERVIGQSFEETGKPW